jgi:hypothetical protein
MPDTIDARRLCESSPVLCFLRRICWPVRYAIHTHDDSACGLIAIMCAGLFLLGLFPIIIQLIAFAWKFFIDLVDTL